MIFKSYCCLITILSFITNAESQLVRCSNRPCKNDARCVDQPSTFYGYNCICVGPWSGINCDQYKGANQGVNSQFNNYNPNMNYPYNNNNNQNNNNYPNINNYPNNNIFPYDGKNNNPYGQVTNACYSSPCFNGAVCQPNGRDSYYCLCRYGFYGNRCENFDNPKGRLLGIILGTILPFFALVIIISCVIYCCCCNRRK